MVQIFSSLPNPPLSFRCQSGNDDLGNHTLTETQSYQWHFCTTPFGNTLYFCSFKWGSKRACFEVFHDEQTQCILPQDKSKWE